jgi:hypothetical protein
MSHKVFGQRDDRQQRNRRYQGWLNCEEVLPGGETVPPPSPADIPTTVEVIRQALQTSTLVRVDVSGDLQAYQQIRQALSPAELTRVVFEGH